MQPLPPPPIDIRLQIYVKPLADGARAVVAFNRHVAPIVANVTWDLLEWAPTQRAAVRDVWAHADLGVTAAIIVVEVPSHAVVMFRITPVA